MDGGKRPVRSKSVGEVVLAYQDLDLPQDPDQTILVFTGTRFAIRGGTAPLGAVDSASE